MSPFIVWTLVFAALSAALAWLARGVFLGYPAKEVPTRNLSRKEQAILAAAADALFPPGGPIPLSGTDAGAIPYLDAYVGRVDRTQRALMRLLFQAVEHGPWVLGPRFSRFTRLTMAYLTNSDVARRMRIEANVAPFAPRDVSAAIRASEPGHEAFA